MTAIVGPTDENGSVLFSTFDRNGGRSYEIYRRIDGVPKKCVQIASDLALEMVKHWCEAVAEKHPSMTFEWIIHPEYHSYEWTPSENDKSQGSFMDGTIIVKSYARFSLHPAAAV